MKSTKNVILLMLFFAIAILPSFAQDTIVKKNKEILKVKIVEIGNTEIKYRYFEAPNGPVILLDKGDVRMVKLEDMPGKPIILADDVMDAGYKNMLTKTNDIKVNFFGPLGHQIAISHEFVIRPGFNWEYGLGLVGPGTGFVDDNPFGFYLRTGPKFLLGNNADVEMVGSNTRYAHPLKGRYLKLEAVFYDISKQVSGPYYPVNAIMPITQKNDFNYLGGALMLVYGRQFLIGNVFSFGYYIGAGYVMEDATMKSNVQNPDFGNYTHDIARYALFNFGNKFPMAMTGGFNVGYIFRTPNWYKKFMATK